LRNGVTDALESSSVLIYVGLEQRICTQKLWQEAVIIKMDNQKKGVN
jgi:hypothetical protein